MDSPREFHICRDTFLHHWRGRGEVKRFIAIASAIKGGLFSKKYESAYHRYIVINPALFRRCP